MSVGLVLPLVLEWTCTTGSPPSNHPILLAVGGDGGELVRDPCGGMHEHCSLVFTVSQLIGEVGIGCQPDLHWNILSYVGHIPSLCDQSPDSKINK